MSVCGYERVPQKSLERHVILQIAEGTVTEQWRCCCRLWQSLEQRVVLEAAQFFWRWLLAHQRHVLTLCVEQDLEMRR